MKCNCWAVKCGDLVTIKGIVHTLNRLSRLVEDFDVFILRNSATDCSILSMIGWKSGLNAVWAGSFMQTGKESLWLKK
jgi:hypothetical protein